MPESVELKVRVGTQGKEQLDAVVDSMRGVANEARSVQAPLVQVDAGMRRVSDSAARQEAVFRQLQRSVARYDVGVGSLVASARRASQEQQRLNEATERSIQALERRAAVAGQSPLARLDIQRKFALADLGKSETQIDRINQAYDRMADSLEAPAAATRKLQGGFTGMAIAAGGFLALGSAVKTATIDLVAQYGAAAQQTERLAASLGIGVAEAERWQAVTRLAGTGTNGLETAAARVAAALEDTSGAGKKVIGVLRELGVAVYTARGETREYGAVARDAITALAGVGDATKRYALAQQLLGLDGAKQLQPLLDHYAEMNATVAELGIGLDDNVTKNLAKAGREMDKLSLAWDTFKQSLADKIAPIIIPMIAVLTRSSTAAGNAAAAGVGGPVPTADTYRSTAGTLLDDSRAMLGIYQAGLGPGALELARTFTDVQGRLLAPVPTPKPPKGGRTTVDTRGPQLQALLDSLDERGLDPLAKLIVDTENRLQALVAKYGPLTGAEQAAASTALQGALRRQTGKNAPVSTPIDVATTGFQFGGLTTLPVAADVDPQRTEATLAQFQERRLRALRQYSAFQEQITRLTAGPGGELAAIEQIAVLREDAAQREFQITRDRARLDEQIDQARKERVLSILELQRKQLQDYKNTAGEVYDALMQRGGGGIRDFFRGQANILQRQLFVNASAGIFQQLGGTLGRVGAASGLGGLLSGTIFDPANAGNTTVANTTATERNTLALERNTAVAAGGGLAGQIQGLTGSGGGDLLSLGIPGLRGTGTGGGSGKLSGIFAGLASPLTAGLFRGFQGGDYSIATGDGTATSASALGLTSTGARVANIAASGAIVAGGTAGILSGLKQGGARGATTAIASGLGVASAIPGPQQPFVQAAALVAGLVTGLFPDAKKQRAEEIGRTLERGRYTDTLGVDRFTDQYGRDLDYNRRGEVRVVQPVTVNVQAMDAKGFLERAQDIGDAVKAALQGGHDVADSMRGLVFVH